MHVSVPTAILRITNPFVHALVRGFLKDSIEHDHGNQDPHQSLLAMTSHNHRMRLARALRN
jgi:hypothetical protein